MRTGAAGAWAGLTRCCDPPGTTEVDAFLGEILTTCAKIDYLLTKGEGALRAEERAGGNLLLAHKVSKVGSGGWKGGGRPGKVEAESGLMIASYGGQLHYEPLGVVCAIVSW